MNKVVIKLLKNDKVMKEMEINFFGGGQENKQNDELLVRQTRQ